MLREGERDWYVSNRAIKLLQELKRRNFLEPKGKQIISTTLGKSWLCLPDVSKALC